jgi:hypothetical protein
MTDFKELKRETLDSLIINDERTSLVFRTTSGFLYFYEGNIQSVSGVIAFDAKYGNSEGLPLKRLKYRDNCLEVPFEKEFLVIIHNGLTYQGKVLESVLKSAASYQQIVEDF